MRIVVTGVILFSMFAITGLIYGTHHRLSDDYLPKVMIGHTSINIDQDSVYIEFQCGEKNPLYRYNIDKSEIITVYRVEETKNIFKSAITDVRDAFPINKELGLSLLGGAGGGYSIKTILNYLEEVKSPRSLINKSKQIVAIVTSIITGYGFGYWASGVFEPECSSKTLHEKLTKGEFWKEVSAIVLYNREILIRKCINNVDYTRDVVDRTIDYMKFFVGWNEGGWNEELDEKFGQPWTDIKQSYEAFENKEKNNSNVISVNTEIGPTQDDFRKRIQSENECNTYKSRFDSFKKLLPTDSSHRLGDIFGFGIY